MSDGMGRESAYLSSHATNRYFIPNWGIYINGRQMRDRSELDRLQSDNIKSVEVITNPGARYAASTRAVIRITTKKMLGEGFGFDV